jgi:ABC-type polysaccharide/polyol phosphate transport system ATPase subunit
MSDVAIRVENVSKIYRLYHNPVTGPIKEWLLPWRKGSYSRSFNAVSDVSFDVRRGEIVGIIGPNGAGKTTLLKMIAGLLPLDGGRIEVAGTITALLALGVGVHPEFSGRENILYGAMLLGVPKATVLERMEEIVAFADLGSFIDQPFRVYSSGMKARLLFAISMSINPDILIVDEALATGDSQFLSKSRRKILELCRSGATILFVSHNLVQVDEICTRTMFITEGVVKYDGKTREAIAEYSRWALQKVGHQSSSSSGPLAMIGGTGDVVVEDMWLLDGENGTDIAVVSSGAAVRLALSLRRHKAGLKEVAVWVGILDPESMEWIAELGARDENLYAVGARIELEGDLTRFSFRLDPLLLQYGRFSFWVVINDPDTRETFSEYKNVRPFVVGGRAQSVSFGTARFWHPYRLERHSL